MLILALDEVYVDGTRGHSVFGLDRLFCEFRNGGLLTDMVRQPSVQ